MNEKQIFILLGSYVIAAISLYAINIVISKLSNSDALQNKLLTKSFLTAIYWPLLCLALLLITCFHIYFYVPALQKNSLLCNQFITLIKVLFTIDIFWFLLLWKNHFKKIWLKKDGISKSHIVAFHMISKCITVLLVLVTSITVMALLHIKISALVTIGGIGAAAFAFASKDIIANFFGGIMLYLNSPFKVGDSIRCSNKELIGTVEEIGWYTTIIRNFEKQPVYIPNSIFIGDFIINITRIKQKRISISIGLRYDDVDKINTISNAIKTMLDEHPNVDTNTPSFVYLSEYADFSVKLSIGIYLDTTDMNVYRHMQQELMLKIAEIVKEHDADFAFPTMSIQFLNDKSETT